MQILTSSAAGETQTQSHAQRFAPAMDRRTLLAGLGASCAALGLPAAASAAAPDGLQARAARRGLAFGCEVRETTLRKTPALRDAILREAGMIVPDIEMKWGSTAPAEGKSDYRGAEALARFASENGLALRGHTAFWHRNVPAWAKAILEGPKGVDLALAHARDIVGHFRGRVAEWDVVNEAIHLHDGRPDGLRDFGPYNQGGVGFIADCFRAAHESDPAALLFYNDFGLEHDHVTQEDKRNATLAMLADLKRRGAPIHGLGIQSHLISSFPFSAPVFRQFIAEVAALGLKIRLTELDVNEEKVEGDVASRDQAAAAVVRRFLETAFDEPAVTGVLTWGLSDFDTWLTGYAPRADGSPQRSLPLDADFKRKPMWQAMADCFDNAPAR